MPPLNRSNNWDITIAEEPPPAPSEYPSSLTDPSEEAIIKSKESCDKDIAASLIPESSTAPEPSTISKPIAEPRVLTDCFQAVKPVKYTYLTADPTLFKNAMASSDKIKWQQAANEELSSIESHKVWEDVRKTPESFLRTVWTFKTKPATLSSTERKKAHLCIQGFTQVEGINYGKTFAPPGKFTTLLKLLMFAIEKGMHL